MDNIKHLDKMGVTMSVESTNLMSGNFVSHDTNESKYSKAREAAANARGQMSNRQNSILAAGIAACANAETLAERIIEGKKAARRMGLDMQQNVSEKNREVLDKMKKRIEEKIEDKNNTADNQLQENTKNATERIKIEANKSEIKVVPSIIDTPQTLQVQQAVLGGDINIEI